MSKSDFYIRMFLTIITVFFTMGLQAQIFENVAQIVGLSSASNNNGVAVADYDGDNDLDIFIVANAVEDQTNEASFSKLFRNNNDGTFTDVTIPSGFEQLLTQEENVEETFAQEGFRFGAFWGDYNNDGFPDLFLTYSLKVQLWRNLGNGTFANVTEISGFNDVNNCINTGATWFDFNNDGYLDIYINDWAECDGNQLYQNDGNGSFVDVTSSVFGDSVENLASYCAFPFDFNEDGFMDLYVSNDFNEPNNLFLNNSGVSFNDEATSYGLNTMGDDMAIAVSDYNNDGSFDFFITAIDDNFFLTNDGNNNFIETADNLNVGNTQWSWGATFSDFDLDGDEDLFVVNGYVFENRSVEPNFYFRNLTIQGQETFINASSELGLDEETVSVETVDFDYDNDGDMDLIVTNNNSNVIFYENRLLNFDDTQNSLNWLKVKLEGTDSNKDAIGTIVTVMANGNEFSRYYSGVGFFSQSLQGVHFGLGDINEIETIEIKWPSGLIETYDTFNTNNTIKFIEGEGYSVLNIVPSQKIYGCTDPVSCNYNEEATLNDGSCFYLPSQNIIGNTVSSFFKTEEYNYVLGAGSQANWQVTGGEIIDGQGTDSITVKWHISEMGRVSVTEINSECSSLNVAINVELGVSELPENVSVARLWNEALLNAIRIDFARPTVHARNLFHTSIAMYDAWAIYDDTAKPYLIGNTVHNYSSELEEIIPIESIEESRNKAISYAMYRLLTHRFQNSPGSEESQFIFNLLMDKLGYDINYTSLLYEYGNAAALGNYIGQIIIDYGLQDGAREATGYDNDFYQPVNSPYALDANSGVNPPINDPNRWQPLALEIFIDQGGQIIDDNTPPFLSPEWGNVKGFALTDEDKITYQRNNNHYNVYHDPSDPPYVNWLAEDSSSEAYKWGFTMVSVWQSHLDPTDGVLWDISPNAIGNINIESFPQDYSEYPNFYNFFNGGSISNGYSINPITGEPYEINIVPRGDYTRVLAEFWADGPDSETPPGHWFTILNYVNDHNQFDPRFQGEGDVMDPLEWNVKSYFILGGGMHDAAISAWSVKGWYDYIRPISAIRSMAERGQSSDNTLDNYDVGGIPLIDDYIEVVQPSDPLAGFANQHVGKIKLFTWRGHDYIGNAETDQAGVGWILAEDWYPYQRPTFVTPPFAGYVSGHSTFSRTAAELMTKMTGSEYFPGGLGEFRAKANDFLVFEEGPSVDVILQWATYRDASDQTSLSRIWGGIHPPADDLPGRFIGQQVAEDVFSFALPYFQGGSISSAENKLSIFPNPIVNKEIFISNTNGGENITLFDLQGKQISLRQKEFNPYTYTTVVKLNNLTSGFYLLKVNNSSQIIIMNN